MAHVVGQGTTRRYTMYMLFYFFKLFPIGCIGLKCHCDSLFVLRVCVQWFVIQSQWHLTIRTTYEEVCHDDVFTLHEVIGIVQATPD